MRPVTLALAAVLVLVLAAGAGAATRIGYSTFSLSSPASSALPVKAPLDEFVAGTTARLIVRTDWKRQATKPTQLSWIEGNARCSYRVTFTTRAVLGADGDAVDRVTGALPSPGRGRLLDSGERGSSAWRVVRPVSEAGTIRLKALRVAVLTKRTDIAPSGQVAWAEVSVTATERAGGECHSGTYRDTLGPALGDILATARTSLHFVRKP